MAYRGAGERVRGREEQLDGHALAVEHVVRRRAPYAAGRCTRSLAPPPRERSSLTGGCKLAHVAHDFEVLEHDEQLGLGLAGRLQRAPDR